MKVHLFHKSDFKHIKPFVSIFIIICTLFSIVFFKMEELRRGYAILTLTREHRQAIERKREKTVQLAKVTRPQHVERLAQNRLTLKKISAKQIIHLTGASITSSNRENSGPGELN